MSIDLLSKTAKELWEREWAEAAQRRDISERNGILQTCPSPALIESLVDLISEDPRRPVAELEPVIHRMLFENQFIDDGGDSVILDAFDSIEVQTRVLVKILEEVRQLGLSEGLWSEIPATPMMFG